MEELKGLVDKLGHDMRENTEAVRLLRTVQERMMVSFRKMRRAQIRSRAVIASLVVVALLIVLVVWRSNVVIGCIRDWANATGDRSTTLTVASQRRSDALDVVARDFGQQPRDQAKTDADYRAYIAASDAYKQATAAHPVPKVSTFGCNFLP